MQVKLSGESFSQTPMAPTVPVTTVPIPPAPAREPVVRGSAMSDPDWLTCKTDKGWQTRPGVRCAAGRPRSGSGFLTGGRRRPGR